MTRAEALDLANKLVTEWAGEVKNQRGYTHDNWKPTDLATRTSAVIQVADWLLAGQGTAPETRPANLVGPAGPGAPPHLHRASCHGPIGELMCGYPANGPTISSP